MYTWNEKTKTFELNMEAVDPLGVIRLNQMLFGSQEKTENLKHWNRVIPKLKTIR